MINMSAKFPRSQDEREREKLQKLPLLSLISVKHTLKSFNFKFFFSDFNPQT